MIFSSYFIFYSRLFYFLILFLKFSCVYSVSHSSKIEIVFSLNAYVEQGLLKDRVYLRISYMLQNSWIVRDLMYDHRYNSKLKVFYLYLQHKIGFLYIFLSKITLFFLICQLHVNLDHKGTQRGSAYDFLPAVAGKLGTRDP